MGIAFDGVIVSLWSSSLVGETMGGLFDDPPLARRLRYLVCDNRGCAPFAGGSPKACGPAVGRRVRPVHHHWSARRPPTGSLHAGRQWRWRLGRGLRQRHPVRRRLVTAKPARKRGRHRFRCVTEWIAGSSPAMTTVDVAAMTTSEAAAIAIYADPSPLPLGEHLQHRLRRPCAQQQQCRLVHARA